MSQTNFKKVVLYTDESDGRSKFREEDVPMPAAGAVGFLSEVQETTGYQFRQSPAGYSSAFHNTGEKQWIFVISGVMRVTLRDESYRDFSAGDSFFCMDTAPARPLNGSQCTSTTL